MKFNEIPKYDSYKVWKTANDLIEVKFIDGGRVVLHLVEDPDADDLRVEDETFYVQSEGDGMIWVREAEGIEMYDGIVDADYVELRSDGRKKETQHNHVHLDNNVTDGSLIPLRVV
jgi:hypothetical protein